MSSAIQQTLPPAVIADVKEAFGCSLLGLVFSMGCVQVLYSVNMPWADSVTMRYSVYGISVLQAYIYFKDSSHDAKHMRLFVSKRALGQ